MLKIKELRTNKNESQTALSKVLGVSLRTIQNYEGGKVNVPREKLELIAKHYDVSVSYLFSNSTSSNVYETPVLKKAGVELNIKEILTFIIDNEDELKKDKQFLRYLNEVGREAIMKYFIDNDLIKK